LRKIVPALLITVLIFSPVLQVNASSSTIKATVDESLFVEYDFENLDLNIYNQTKANSQLFNVTTIPQIIVKNFESKNQTLVRWGLGPETDIYDDANRAIHVSFFLGGSDVVSFKVNGTTMKRTYEVKTEWRRFKVNLTSDFSVDFGQRLAKPVAEWQKTNETTFYFESRETGTLDLFFYLVLPASASSVSVQGDTVFYDMPPRFEDQLLNSPFLILGALAIVLAIVLIYRKVR